MTHDIDRHLESKDPVHTPANEEAARDIVAGVDTAELQCLIDNINDGSFTKAGFHADLISACDLAHQITDALEKAERKMRGAE